MQAKKPLTGPAARRLSQGRLSEESRGHQGRMPPPNMGRARTGLPEWRRAIKCESSHTHDWRIWLTDHEAKPCLACEMDVLEVANWKLTVVTTPYHWLTRLGAPKVCDDSSDYFDFDPSRLLRHLQVI